MTNLNATQGLKTFAEQYQLQPAALQQPAPAPNMAAPQQMNAIDNKNTQNGDSVQIQGKEKNTKKTVGIIAGLVLVAGAIAYALKNKAIPAKGAQEAEEAVKKAQSKGAAKKGAETLSGNDLVDKAIKTAEELKVKANLIIKKAKGVVKDVNKSYQKAQTVVAGGGTLKPSTKITPAAGSSDVIFEELDKKGNTIRKSLFDSAGKLKSIEELDKKGNVINTIAVDDSTGKLKTITKKPVQTTPKGKLKGEVIDIAGKDQYTYTKNGQALEVKKGKIRSFIDVIKEKATPGTVDAATGKRVDTQTRKVATMLTLDKKGKLKGYTDNAKAVIEKTYKNATNATDGVLEGTKASTKAKHILTANKDGEVVKMGKKARKKFLQA